MVTIYIVINSTLSLRFNGHFPGEPGLAGVFWSKGWWRWWWQLDYWSYKSCKAPPKSSPPTNQHPIFYRPDALPVAQPTVSKYWREKYHIPWTCLPRAHLGVFQLCLWPLIAPGYLGGELPCLSSALWCQYPWLTPLLYNNILPVLLVAFEVMLLFSSPVYKSNFSYTPFLMPRRLIGMTQTTEPQMFLVYV